MCFVRLSNKMERNSKAGDKARLERIEQALEEWRAAESRFKEQQSKKYCKIIYKEYCGVSVEEGG